MYSYEEPGMDEMNYRHRLDAVEPRDQTGDDRHQPATQFRPHGEKVERIPAGIGA